MISPHKMPFQFNCVVLKQEWSGGKIEKENREFLLWKFFYHARMRFDAM